jgi:hypothetical protein
MALRKHNLLTCAVAAAVAFEKLSRTPWDGDATARNLLTPWP